MKIDNKELEKLVRYISLLTNTPHAEEDVQRCSVKKVFLEISQNSQENTCSRVSFLIKLQASCLKLYEKRLWHRCFPVNLAKFLWMPFLTEHLRWLFLFHNIKNNPIQITRTLKSSNWNKNDKDQNWRDKNSYWWLKYNINPFLISTVELSVLRFKK